MLKIYLVTYFILLIYVTLSDMITGMVNPIFNLLFLSISIELAIMQYLYINLYMIVYTFFIFYLIHQFTNTFGGADVFALPAILYLVTLYNFVTFVTCIFLFYLFTYINISLFTDPKRISIPVRAIPYFSFSCLTTFLISHAV